MKRFLLFALIPISFAFAQFSTSIEAVYIQPVGGFSNWFNSHYSGTIYVGGVEDGGFISGKLEFYKFYRENTKKLFYKDLKLELKIYGLGVEYRHTLWKFYFVNFYGLLGTGIYRWFGVRGEYFFRDSVGNIIDYIDENRQQDWSAGFCGGFGVGINVFKNLSLNLNARYQIIVGEMWQTLALRLEQASGFQWVGAQAGVQVKF